MFSEKIIIEGIVYDCVKHAIDEFNIKVSIPDGKNIFDIYRSRREIPLSYNGYSRSCFILNIIRQDYSTSNGDVIILIKVG